MSSDKCPYCGKDIKINHDNGYGYDENKIYNQTCVYCDKTFIYTTSIIICHETYQAPCQNGEPHKLKEIRGGPEEFYKYMRRCEICGEEIIIDKDAHGKEVKKYFNKLKEESK